MGDEEALEARVLQLESRLQSQAAQHASELESMQSDLKKLQGIVQELEDSGRIPEGGAVVGGNSKSDQYTRRVEWTISDFSTKGAELAKGSSLWSPKFRAAGMDQMQLEFFPKGRETTTFDGFCSLFLWCPSGTKIKYQLWVGSFLRAPDEDTYNGRIGHGHSNFCPIAPEVDKQNDCVVVGVNFLEVVNQKEICSQGLRLFPTPLHEMVAKEVEIVQHRSVNKVVWKISKVSERMQQLPRGASMWSKLFTAAGIPEILFEFYPNGSTNTTKDGFCAFYIRCPEGVSMIVTLFVGSVRKGPIKTTFDSLTGKGLPDFCLLKEQINQEDDSLEVGIELQNQPTKTLQIES